MEILAWCRPGENKTKAMQNNPLDYELDSRRETDMDSFVTKS
jgi:hypothetical protein